MPFGSRFLNILLFPSASSLDIALHTSQGVGLICVLFVKAYSLERTVVRSGEAKEDPKDRKDQGQAEKGGDAAAINASDANGEKEKVSEEEKDAEMQAQVQATGAPVLLAGAAAIGSEDLERSSEKGEREERFLEARRVPGKRGT